MGALCRHPHPKTDCEAVLGLVYLIRASPPLNLASVTYYVNLEEFHILDLAFVLYFRRFLLDRPALLRTSGHESAALTFQVGRHVRTDRGRTIGEAFL